MRTLAEAIARHGVDVLDHLDRAAAVPVTAGLARQGDVIVVPAAMVGHLPDATTQAPPSRSGVLAVGADGAGGQVQGTA